MALYDPPFFSATCRVLGREELNCGFHSDMLSYAEALVHVFYSESHTFHGRKPEN